MPITPMIDATAQARLYLDVDPTHPEGPRLALFDTQGRLLPGQIATEFTHVEGEGMTMAVRFAVDHDYVRFAAAGELSVSVASKVAENPGLYPWEVTRAALPEKFRDRLEGSILQFYGPEKPEDARRALERLLRITPGTLGNTAITRVVSAHP